MTTTLSSDLSGLGFREDFIPPESLEERLQALASYDLWFVEERLKVKGILPEESIAPAILGFRRYVAIHLLGYEGYSPSPDVDEVWHAFILFTKDYGEFCRRVCGHFLHHVPHTSRDRKSNHPATPSAELRQQLFAVCNDGGECFGRGVIEDGECWNVTGEKAAKCAIFCGIRTAERAACGCMHGCKSSEESCGSCG